MIPLQWSNLCYLPVRQILNSSAIWRSSFFSQSAKINPFQGWAVNSVAPAVLMHCGSSGGDKMGDLLKTNQLNVTFIDPILSQSAVTDWVLRANAETCR